MPAGKTRQTRGGATRLVRACTILRSPAELYQAWRKLEDNPRFMTDLESVTVVSATESRWNARIGGKRIQWQATITADEPDRYFAWRAAEKSDFPHTGSVRFTPAPGGQGTEVTATLTYNPPAGGLGRLVAKMVGKEPGQYLGENLRRFKALMECGEIPTIAGQPVGRAQRKERR